MTYEKFEHKVIGMLLEGNDPRLEKLIMQTWDIEVLSRDETEMGFNVKFLAPSPLAINESEGRVFGVEVKLSESEIFHVELVIKDGLIDRLKGTSTTEMSYADVVKRYNDLTFSYKNNESSEMNFKSDAKESDEVTFVKNISTISKEIDASISKGLEAEKEEIKASTDSELIEEPFTLASDVKEVEVEAKVEATHTETNQIVEEEAIEDVDDNRLVEEPFTLVSDVKESEVEAVKIPEETKVPEKIEMPEISKTTNAPDPTEKSLDEAKEERASFTSKEEDIMMPPSFSIPKVPDVIQKRWSGEAAVLDQAIQPVIPTPIPVPSIDKKIAMPDHARADDAVKERTFTDILDGKAPQGPVSFSEPMDAKGAQEKKVEFKNLTPKELSNPDLEVVSPVEIALEELESEALSAVDLNEVERSIELMEQKNKTLRVTTILIVVITIILIWFIISLYA